MEKTCTVCGNIYQAKRDFSKYCSPLCRGRAQEPRHPKVCQVCGKDYMAQKFNSKYCSMFCRGRAMAPDPAPIVELWKQGKGCYEIAYILKLGHHRVEHTVKKLGLYEPRFATAENGRHAKAGGHTLLGGYRKHRPSIADYRDIAFEAHGAKCSVCGYDKYINVLEIDHVDRNRSNNTPENLVVYCPTHHAEHHYEQKTGRYSWAKRTGKRKQTRDKR